MIQKLHKSNYEKIIMNFYNIEHCVPCHSKKIELKTQRVHEVKKINFTRGRLDQLN